MAQAKRLVPFKYNYFFLMISLPKNPPAKPAASATIPTMISHHQAIPFLLFSGAAFVVVSAGLISEGVVSFGVVSEGFVSGGVVSLGRSSTVPSCAAARLTITVYSFLSPFSAVTVIVTLVVPLGVRFGLLTETFALPSAAVADTFSLETSKGTLAL